MKKSARPGWFGILFPCIVTVLIVTLLSPRGRRFDYRYSKGGTWDYETLVAPFDFPILKTDEQVAKEKERHRDSYVPYFRYSEDACQNLEQRVAGALPDYPDIASAFVSRLNACYERGVLPDGGIWSDADEDELSYEIVFVQRDKKAAKMPRAELYTPEKVRSGILHELQEEFDGINVDSLLDVSGLYSMISANLIFDSRATEQIHKESVSYISPTSGTFRAGDVIVSGGETVTAEIKQILDSYKAEYRNVMGYSGPDYLQWLGSFLMSIVLTLLLASLVWFTRPAIMARKNEFVFILCIFCLSALMADVVCRLPSSLSFIMPFPVLALYYMAFFRTKLTIPLYAVTLLPVLVFCNGGPQLYTIYLMSGFVAVYSFSRFNRGWKQFLTALFILASMAAVYLVFRFFNGTLSLIEPSELLFMIPGALAAILTYQLVYLFEILFNLVSVSRLVELADTGSPLLKMLADKAPGTFQHSIAVMNMAEAVGAKIDADVPLLRAAALYHDIGKAVNPLCFVENQTAAVNYHEGLSPKESAQIIINHVKAGLELAEKYKIPSVIKDFIACHHGTSATGYFYNVYLNAGGNPDDVAEFFYPGPRPRTKEQVILMLCDSLEAASRTQTDFSPEAVKAFIHGIHYSKYSERQYDDADITLRELQVLRDSLETYIVNLHHSRVVYPSIERNKK